MANPVFITIYNDLTAIFCDELIKLRTELVENPPVTSSNIQQLGQSETEFHIKTHDNTEHLAKTPLHNLLPPVYKLLTDRTLDMLYDRAIERYMIINPANMSQVSAHILSVGLGQWLRYMILTSPAVCEIMMPLARDLDSYVRGEIARLDMIPYVEQKSQEWLAIRNNMISASVAGYYDASVCGCGMSKEYGVIKEKGGIQESKKLSWGVAPIRHGMTFEDLSGALYNIFNNVSSKEYGILPDQTHSVIGASPDGIITGVRDPESWLNLRKMGRMREIKNPTDRLINEKVPNYYYWQMVQQMYVCRLPMCDFIQTSFVYPNESTPSAFIQDTLDISLLPTITTWSGLVKLFKPASDEFYSNSSSTSLILDKLDWSNLVNHNLLDADWMSKSLEELNTYLTRLVIDNWNTVSHIPLANINRTGDIKGVLWCFTKPDGTGGTDFEVLFMSPEMPINTEDDIQAFYDAGSPTILAKGYTLESTHYWACKKYLDFEVEYNQAMYEGRMPDTPGSLSRLLDKWGLVTRLRAIPDMESKLQVYYEAYPADNPINKKPRASTASASSSKSWGYTKRIKKDTKDYPELDLS